MGDQKLISCDIVHGQSTNDELNVTLLQSLNIFRKTQENVQKKS